ncbi:MAG: hypothetical protein H0T79_05305 [Deltaproteobacteria bacterium]|nr:hypothetical protein [Deltaproteobacteria bacterium]
MRKTSPELALETVIGIARELADPLRILRDRLGLVVDHIERHVASSTGPNPYPWRSLQTLRQDLGAAYLDATALARRLEELERALEVGDGGPVWFDLAAAVDLGLRLANQHLGAGIELLIDLGTTDPVRGAPGPLALVIAQLVAVSAQSARSLEGSTLTVRVTNYTDGDAELGGDYAGGYASVLVADNGAGSERAAALGDLARAVLLPWGATIEAASEPQQGCVFELRFITHPA